MTYYHTVPPPWNGGKLRADLIDTFRKRSDDKPINGPSKTGAASGYGLAIIGQMSGANTALHEEGHVMASNLLYDYAPGTEKPHVQLDAKENIKAIPKEGLNGIYRWLTGYDRNHDGFSGFATHGEGKPNELGEALGPRGSSLTISLAGSLPGLIINTMAVSGGLKLRKKHPRTAYALMGYGVTSHAMTSVYPWTAAMMSTPKLEANAADGHDFANLAVQLSEMTGVSARTIAMTTAVGWTALFPALFLGVYLNNKSTETNIVSDSQALKHWLLKAQSDKETKNEFQELLKAYPRKEALRNVSDNDAYLREVEQFAAYLIEAMPKKQKVAIKKEVIDSWKDTGKVSRGKKLAGRVSIFGFICYTAANIVKVMSQTVFPVLSKTSHALNIATPIFAVISLTLSAYETISDCRNPLLPKKAKMMSVAKLIANIVIYTAFAVAIFCPGVNVFIIATIVLGYTGLIIASVAKNNIIKHRFELEQAKEKENFAFMSGWLRDVKKRNISHKDEKFDNLNLWVKCVKEAEKENMLSDSQRNELIKLKVIKPKRAPFIQELKRKLHLT